MIIIGVDFHPSMQEIAFLDQETGEYVERQLNHSDGEAEKFYQCADVFAHRDVSPVRNRSASLLCGYHQPPPNAW
jgi:hypothetical protein